MQKWLWIILHQRFSSYTTAFLKNAVMFYLKDGGVLKKDGRLFHKTVWCNFMRLIVCLFLISVDGFLFH